MYLILPVFVMSVMAGLLAMPWLTKRLAHVGMTGPDVNKPHRPELPNVGGIGVIFAMACGVLLASGLSMLGVWPPLETSMVLAGFECVLAVSFIGLVDDLLRLPPHVKGLLTLLSAVPLIAVSGASSTVDVPFLGAVDFGLIYPLVLIPIGVTGASNVTNMLAGFNGSEAGMGAVACFAMGVVTVMGGHVAAAVLLFAMLGALLAFLPYSWFPARAFIGDTGTLAIGATLASAAVIGHDEVVGIIVILPYAADFVLKALNRFPSTGWWGTWRDGKLVHTGRPVGLGQALMRATGGVAERDLVLILIGLEVAAAVVAVAFVVHL